MIVGIWTRRCRRGVWVGFISFQICSAVDETSSEGRPLDLEMAPTGLMRSGSGVDVDAV